MSEQFAIQPEEFDSTNERLDSILDRLNSLGQSAAEMKAAPLRPLQSVPDLDDISPDEGVLEAPDLVPPAVPQLGLVPPVIPTDEDVFEVDDTEASTAALRSLDTVDLGADFETVTAIEADHELDLDAELAPHDLEAPEPGSVLIANEASSELDLADQVTDEDIAVAEAADSEAIAAEVEEVAGFEAEVVSTEMAAPVAPVAEIVETPVPETVVAETVVAEAPVEPAATEPVAADVFDTEITSPHSIFDQVAPTSTEQAITEPQVFEFDESAETVPSQPERPEAPTSIFSSSLGSSDNKKSQQPAAAESDGWITHTVPQNEFGTEESVTAEAEIAAPAIGSFFDQDIASIPEPAVEQVDPQMLANEVEQTLVEIDELDADNPFSPDAPETSFAIAGIDSPLTDDVPSSFDALETAVPETADLYDSDADLPLPDFTGVYDEPAETSEVVPSPKIARASDRDRELDKLRPEEDDLDSLVMEAEANKRVNWTLRLQLLMVVGFGVAVLVLIWLQDPTAVTDMRNELDALLGRN